MKLSNVKNAFLSLSLAQYAWLWVAYWRLWWVQIQLKVFKKQAWLNSRLHISDVKKSMSEELHSNNLEHNSAIDNMRLAEQMHESIRLAARLQVWPTACLPRSIVLVDMLETRSLNAKVCIGVSKAGNQLASHAWVELEGDMVAEPESVQHEFTPIVR